MNHNTPKFFLLYACIVKSWKTITCKYTVTTWPRLPQNRRCYKSLFFSRRREAFVQFWYETACSLTKEVWTVDEMIFTHSQGEKKGSRGSLILRVLWIRPREVFLNFLNFFICMHTKREGFFFFIFTNRSTVI